MANLQSSTISGNTMWHTGNHGRTINRGNPGSGSPLLLSKLGEVHHYSANSVTTIDISTEMVEDSMYELYYTWTDQSGTNCDPNILPNYTTYGSQFTGFYWGSPGFAVFNQTLSSFYTDHYAGGVGNLAVGRYILFNRRGHKQIIYQGGDTESVCQGAVRWNNNTTQWQYVGRMSGYPSGNIKVWVRRIG